MIFRPALEFMSLLLQIHHFGMVGRNEMEYKKQLRGRKGKGKLFDLVLHAEVHWTIIYSHSSMPQYILQNYLACHFYKSINARLELERV